MKKKLMLIFAMAMLLACAFAISVFAAGEKVTLKDGTSLDLWAEDGSGLIWYISGTDASGNPIYSSISNLQQDATAGKAYVKYTGNTKTSHRNMTGITIYNENGDSFGVSTIVVANLRYTAEKPLCLPGQSEGFNSFHDNSSYGLFKNCTKLEYILVPDALARVIGNTFYGCSSLKEFDTSNTRLVSIGGAAFQNCTSLVSVSLPACFTSFDGQNIFYGCTSLKTVNGLDTVIKNIANANGAIPNGLFRNCSNLETDIVLYEGITAIGEYAFIKCTKVKTFTNLVIPNTVITLARSSFNGCTQMQSVRLGASLTNNGTGFWFADCTSLKEMYIPATLARFDGEVVRSISGNCVFYFTGNMTQATSFKSNTSNNKNPALKSAQIKSYSEFIALEELSGSYLVYDYPLCDAFYAGAHEMADTVSYTAFDAVGEKISSCTVNGCCHSTKVDALPLFTCLGYSAPTFGESGGIALGYTVNLQAINEYTEATGATLTYGVFAVAYENIGTNDVFDENGTPAGSVISAEISNREFVAFELAIVGFTDEYKTAKLAMGAYVAVTKDDTTTYSYMQDTTKGELIGNYYFASYNNVIGVE